MRYNKSDNAISWSDVRLPGVPVAALNCRLTREGMINVLSEDYILNALSKGIPKRRVVVKYALKNALIPVITVIGVQIGSFLGGTIVTEQFFSLPGMGRMIMQSISRRDFIRRTLIPRHFCLPFPPSRTERISNVSFWREMCPAPSTRLPAAASANAVGWLMNAVLEKSLK